MVPTDPAEYMSTRARVLTSAGHQNLTTFCTQGYVTPSPAPIIALLPSSTGSVLPAAAGVVMVNMLHSTTPQPSTCLVPTLEAK